MFFFSSNFCNLVKKGGKCKKDLRKKKQKIHHILMKKSKSPQI